MSKQQPKDNKSNKQDDSRFSVGDVSQESASGTQLTLKDGSVFAIGGVQSSLSLLVDADKIAGESQVFSIGKSDQVQPDEEESEQEKYGVNRELARGGMGAILEAWDNDLRRIIAMKVILSGVKATDSEYERFIKEAQVTGILEHPNIVPVHELGVDKNSRPFFTMKLVGGESLQSILRKIGNGEEAYRDKYPLTRLLTILTQVCNAISFAHSRGVVHRDLKPENIMVGDFGEVLVMDWGLAKIENIKEMQVYRDLPADKDPTKTIEGSVLGTPAYMPPEQAKGDAASTDERSDVFSLGAILYEMIIGKPPYSGDTIMAVLAKAVRVEIEGLRKMKKVPKELARICLKAMESQKEDRYQSAGDLAEAVESFVDNRVIPEYSLKPWQKLLESLGIIILFALLIPIGGLQGFNAIQEYLNLPSYLMVTSCGLFYQILVVGGRLSFLGRLRKANRSVAQTTGSLKLQEGCILGGVLGTLLGTLAMIGAIQGKVWDKSTMWSGAGLALLTVAYIYPIFLIFRVDHIREARQNSLFGVISPSRPSVLLQMVFLYSILYLPVVVLVATLEPGGFRGFYETAVMGTSISYIVSYSCYVFAISLVACILCFRIVFTIKELWAAVGHFFTFLRYCQ